MTDALKVATAQYPLDAIATFEAWEEKVASWVERGARSSARLLVFPEYGAIELAAIGGVAVTSDLHATLATAADNADRAAEVWRSLAARHGVHILAPSGPERRGSDFVNASRLHAPAGRSGTQDKLILTPFERDWGMAPGRVQRVFETELGRIGIAICYDSEFPLQVRALTEAGAEIILIPTCTEHVTGFHRVRHAALARALESQIATVMSATVGTALWSAAVDRNCGAAGIYVPPDIMLSSDGVVVQGRLDEPDWIIGTIDRVRLAALRSTGEMRNWQDWSLQKGAVPLASAVEAVNLRG